MSIQLKLDNVDFDQPKEKHLQMQYIPASIDATTNTNIDQFFNNYTTEVDGCKYRAVLCLKIYHRCFNNTKMLFAVLKNSLRGFPLNGCPFEVPKTHRGIVFQEDHRPLDENAERTFKVTGIFNEFTYWNYDKQPSENDKLKQALGWNDLAKVVRHIY